MFLSLECSHIPSCDSPWKTFLTCTVWQQEGWMWFPQGLRGTGMEMRFLHTHQGSFFREGGLCLSSSCIHFELGRSQKCHVAGGMLHCQNTSLSIESKKQCELIGKILPDQIWYLRLPLEQRKKQSASPKTCPECVFFFLNFPFSLEERVLAIIVKRLHRVQRCCLLPVQGVYPPAS